MSEDWDLRGGHTERRFVRYDFTDLYGEKCSLQKSSLAEVDAVWFGCNDGGKRHHVTGDQLGARMHLTQEMVRQLLPLLRRFAERGDLPGPREIAPSWPPPGPGEPPERNALKSVIAHWDEFGPEFGFAEVIEAARKAVQP